MGATLEAIRRLHEVDVQLHQFRRKLTEKQGLIRQNEKRIADLRQQAQAKRAQAARQQAQADDLNRKLKEHEERIAKLRMALNTTRTQRDYADLLTEINLERSEAGKLEESALAAMTAVEQTQQQEKQLLESMAQFESRNDALRSEGQAQAADDSEAVGRLTALRAAASENLSPAFLAEYERMQEYHEGDSLAVIEIVGKGKNAEYVCGGCNMGIRYEQVNAILTRDQINTCGACGRILLMPLEPAPAAADAANSTATSAGKSPSKAKDKAPAAV